MKQKNLKRNILAQWLKNAILGQNKVFLRKTFTEFLYFFGHIELIIQQNQDYLSLLQGCSLFLDKQGAKKNLKNFQ